MINFYKTEDGVLRKIDGMCHDCWVSVIAPTEEEIVRLKTEFSISGEFISAALDEEEAARIETEDGQTLIIMDIPFADRSEENEVYTTMPIGIITTSECIMTISLRENIVLRDMTAGLVKNVNTKYKTEFVLYMLQRMAARFLQYLRQIDKRTSHMEKLLRKSMRNKELIQLMDLQKSLVYFQTSLKSNESNLGRIMRGRYIKMYEDDQDLLEDVLIELKQAIEMCDIYSSILSGTMDAFASVISNNLNIVMKLLASITIIMAIPTMVFSFYGMNIGTESGTLPFAGTIWVPLAVSVVATFIAGVILYKKDLF